MILDDDAPELRISASGTLTEGDGNTAGYTITSKVPVTSLSRIFTLQRVLIFLNQDLV